MAEFLWECNREMNLRYLLRFGTPLAHSILEPSGAIIPFPQGGPLFIRWWRRRTGRTVRQDWFAELSTDKTELFGSVRRELEIAYSVFGVALDEALAKRKQGRIKVAREHVAVSAALCLRFAASLENMLDALERHARSFVTPPNITDLDPDFFRGTKARQAVLLHNLLSRIVFGLNNRFLHKIRTLAEIAEDLAEEYLDAVAEVVDATRVPGESGWEQLQHLQFDLTTVFRESEILLKSFLVELPGDDVSTFRTRIALALSAAPLLADRRAAAFRRQYERSAGIF